MNIPTMLSEPPERRRRWMRDTRLSPLAALCTIALLSLAGWFLVLWPLWRLAR